MWSRDKLTNPVDMNSFHLPRLVILKPISLILFTHSSSSYCFLILALVAFFCLSPPTSPIHFAHHFPLLPWILKYPCVFRYFTFYTLVSWARRSYKVLCFLQNTFAVSCDTLFYTTSAPSHIYLWNLKQMQNATHIWKYQWKLCSSAEKHRWKLKISSKWCEWSWEKWILWNIQ